ncbi:MAG TPA: DUF4271 domain-containing protein [Sphingobacteriaceae bacterium]|nr:DUF4271 domain-containing protein [Sphingobacteriaceae bacterium]
MLYSIAMILLYAERQPRDLWVILSLALLIALVGLVRALFPGAFGRIIGAFFDNTLLNQLIKEDTPFLSWPYLLLYIVMGFSVGMFLFLAQLSGFLSVAYVVDVRVFLVLSLSVIVLFAIKIMVLRVIAHVFDIKRLFRGYETALFLSYYNVAFLLLVFALMMSLLPFSEANWLVPTALSLAGVMLVFRLGKSAFEIIRNYRFPIFYFIVYLCTLELAPILILIKIVSR